MQIKKLLNTLSCTNVNPYSVICTFRIKLNFTSIHKERHLYRIHKNANTHQCKKDTKYVFNQKSINQSAYMNAEIERWRGEVFPPPSNKYLGTEVGVQLGTVKFFLVCQLDMYCMICGKRRIPVYTHNHQACYRSGGNCSREKTHKNHFCAGGRGRDRLPELQRADHHQPQAPAPLSHREPAGRTFPQRLVRE